VSNTKLNDVVFDAIFVQAVIDNFMDELDSLPQDKELAQNYMYSASHEERMRRLFKREKLKDYFKSMTVYLKKVAAIIVIIAALLFGGMMTIPQVRATTVQSFVKWFDEFTKFAPQGTESNEWEPSYLPNGYSEIDKVTSAELSFIVFQDNKGNQFSFTYVPANGSVSVNNEEVDYSQITDGSIVYHIFVSENGMKNSSIIWDQDGLRFTLEGKLTKDELLKVARSVEK